MDQQLYLLGLNHRTAPVEVREKYALTGVDNFDNTVFALDEVDECMSVSTCNRVEIMAVGGPGDAPQERVLQHWAETCDGSAEELRPHVYSHAGRDAVLHVFQVASSLDSMVLGEPQILGQLKDSYRSALEAGTARTILNRLMHKAFFTAKRVRTETSIASSAVSISYAAVELARKIFGDMSDKAAMLVGAGEMAELAAAHLLNNGVRQLYIVNRTLSRARELAKSMNGTACPFEELADRLVDADIVISSTGAQNTVIQARDVKGVLKKRKYRPMFFIDIAVPRDIDPDVNALDNVYLYDIDDLKEVVEENIAQRRDEAVKAHALVEIEADAFGDWLKSLDLQPTIVDLMGRGEELARRELAKTLKRLGDVDDDTRKALETLVLSVSRKVLHEPICFLKRRTREEGVAGRFIDMVRRMFNLDRDVVPEDAHSDRRTPESEAACAPDEFDSEK